MLPRITIGPDLSSRPSIRSATSSRPSTSNELSRKKPVRTNALAPTRPHAAASRQSGGNVAPSRRSLEGVRAIDTSLQGLAASSSLYDSATSSSNDASPAHSDAAAAAASADASPGPGNLQAAAAGTGSSSAASLRRAASAASLSASEADLAVLLGGASGDAAPPPGSTVISFGSIPMFVPVAYVDVPAAAEAADAVPASAAAASTASQGEASEPGTPAAAVEGDTANSSSSSTPTNLDAGSAEFYPPPAYLAAAAAATALAAASASSGASSRTHSSQQLASSQGEELAAAAPSAADSHDDDQQQQQQVHPQAAEAAAAAAAAASAWQQQQQLYWQHHQHMAWQQQQHWQQQQQWHPMQQVPAPPVFYYPMAYPYMPLPQMHYQQQQEQYAQQQQLPYYAHHQQQQQTPAADAGEHCDAAAAAAADISVPASPCASSMVSFDPASAAGWPGSAAGEAAGSCHPYDDWHGSSASSVASGYSSGYRRHAASGSSTSGSSARQHTPRDVSTVTVTPVSSVKDAAGALAKVVSRHGSGVLLALSRVGDQAAQVTHVAAKSLAVARFYVNSHMSAEGAAGVGAAAALTGVEPPSPAAVLAAAVEDELVFMPYFRAGSGGSSGPEPAISFLVAKAAASELPSQLPPPVGVPACMVDQQQQPAGSSASASGTTTSTGRGPLLRAGMSTDVNKLSNAIIHNVLASGHVGLQLAGAAACQIAMKALIKASSRLQRKFAEHVVATASFANVDTNSSIGRATVFLRVDVMRSSLLQQLAESGREAGEQLGRQVAEAFAAVVEGSRPQQAQPAGAFA